ncbi:MAG: efflux RND transporter permease subunit [Gammaproteobacteria bacterium]|nr:efflux RND transporter permease subunit [Gammaproteobacteria bacterium]
MAHFFIDRPVFAWVIALFISLIGLVAIGNLPIAQYPTIAPPAIVITASYPGANASTVDSTVTSVIEQELNGAEGMRYIESQSDVNGQSTVTVTFNPGINPDLAAVDVQNRIKRIEPKLPQAVQQQGVIVSKARTNFLLFVTFSSTDGSLTPIDLGDYVSRSVLNELQRVPGVGQALLFGTERALRIWLEPHKLSEYKINVPEVVAAIREQNAQVIAGSLSDQPTVQGQTTTAPIVVKGQLANLQDFENIVLRSHANGSLLKLKDVAQISIGGQSYVRSARTNGHPNTAVAIQLTSTANALDTAQAVRKKMDTLTKYFPKSVRYDIPYDTSKFIKISILETVKTLFEAIGLVFIVILIFLQNLRYTLIPIVVVPITLLGTMAVLAAFGSSINVLTMFGMVLAIGIVVDDAIVVVENVERVMREDNLPPREATRKAMSQITNPIIGITLVLTAVFIPMAFFDGAVGAIYRQFSLSMASSMIISAALALSLTPALCATLLPKTNPHSEKSPWRWFNSGFTRFIDKYVHLTSFVLKRPARFMLLYASIIGFLIWSFGQLPSSFLPAEDQGFIITNVQLPPGATAERTSQVLEKVERYYLDQPMVEATVATVGFSFSGAGQNAGLIFTPLKDWELRGKEDSSMAIARRALTEFQKNPDAIIFPTNPPPIRELGNATGFALRLQDRASLGYTALLAARNQLIALATQSPVLKGTRPEGLEGTGQLELVIDRDKVYALGLTFANINNTLSNAWSPSYVNDFPNFGRQQRVLLQLSPAERLQEQQLLNLQVRNVYGNMVPFSAFATTKWTTGPVQLIRFNGYPSVRIAGDAAPGYSTGQALEEIEKLVEKLPQGIGYEWTAGSYEEKLSGTQAPLLFALSLIVVLLCLSALYESVTIPFAVLLVIPLGVLGGILGALMTNLPNDVYFKVGLVAIIGLSAKNAILIIEFARHQQMQGLDIFSALLQAVKLRIRPVLMTSLAFILGVLPLAIATGAGAGSQRAVGTGVMGGMISSTLIGIFAIPLFYFVIGSIFKKSSKNI